MTTSQKLVFSLVVCACVWYLVFAGARGGRQVHWVPSSITFHFAVCVCGICTPVFAGAAVADNELGAFLYHFPPYC